MLDTLKAVFLIVWLSDHTAAWRLRESQSVTGSQFICVPRVRVHTRISVCALTAQLPWKVGFSEPELNFRNTPFP